MSSFFFNLGRQLGRKAVPAIRKSKIIWDGLTGTEEEALRAEVRLGTEMAAELRATVEWVTDPQAAALASDICRRLAACVRNNRRTFSCELFHDPCPNAIALPGGFLFLSDSLLELCGRQPDELAFVVGHEMAHVLRGHAWDRMLNEAMLRALAAAASRVGQVGVWLRERGLELLRSAHSREQELDADELGLRLAMAAGFAADGAVLLLQRIGRLRPAPSAFGQYLASHPAPHERIARLQSFLRQVPGQPAPRPNE